MGFALSPMQLRSNSFAADSAIAKRHTMEGENVSPHLSWTGAPEQTGSFAIVCHDPDAPLVQPGGYGCVHWVLYNLPASVTELAENATLGTCGINNFGKQAYSGPMPPPGHGTHHYFFTVLALDQELNLEAGLSLWQLMSRIEPHVLGMNRLMCTYQR